MTLPHLLSASEFTSSLFRYNQIMKDFSFTLPSIQDDDHIADFIATRMEQAANLKEQGREEECKELLRSAYAVAQEADDEVSLGFLYLVLDPSDI